MKTDTEPKILDLNGMYWTDRGVEFEFIDLQVNQIEQTINRLLIGMCDGFGEALQGELLEQLKSHTHIIKNGAAYSYIVHAGDLPEYTQITLRCIPTDFDDAGNIV